MTDVFDGEVLVEDGVCPPEEEDAIWRHVTGRVGRVQNGQHAAQLVDHVSEVKGSIGYKQVCMCV